MDRDEWEFCRDNLFGENLSMKKKALEHLYVWKVRYGISLSEFPFLKKNRWINLPSYSNKTTV